MKKIYKALAGICLAGALCGGAFAVSGCGDTQTDTVIGEYHYINYGVFYGVRVNVEVQTDSKGDRIRKVTIADSDYTQLSPANPDYGWTDADRENYSSQEQTLLNAYRGMYVADVLAMDVETAANGEPQGVSDDSVLISGATQSSGRLLLAVQDALLKFDNYNVYEGEYHYPNAWSPSSPEYGIRVRVVVKGDYINKVVVLNSGYTEVSDSKYYDKNIWLNGLDSLLDAYAGRKVKDVMAVSVDVNSTASMGQPYTVSDSSLMITGATQGSGRLLLAVQNALGASNDVPSPYDGWNATSMIDTDKTSYTVKDNVVTYNITTVANRPAVAFEIEVVVTDGVITSYEIKVDGSTGSKYTDKIFDGFVGKDAAFFASIIGEKGDIGTKDNYEANGIETGATKSNYLCLSAALFATSNYDRAIVEGAESGGYGNSGSSDDVTDQFEGWNATAMIDTANTTYTVNGNAVTYHITTVANRPAKAFVIDVVVTDGTITSYTIATDGSTATEYTDLIFSGFVGKNAAFFASIIGESGDNNTNSNYAANEISTGATKSNYLCLSAALFATSNYSLAVANN